MVKRTQTKQDRVKERLQSIYLTPTNVTPLNLGIIQEPKIFSNSAHDKAFNKGVRRAREDLQLLDFFITNLRPKYRNQITNSNEFHNVLQSILNISSEKYNKMSKEELENLNALAIQLLSYSLQIIVRTTPPEFLKLVKDASIPLNNLLKSIYNYSKNNNLKDLPNFRELQFPITERD